MATKTFPYAVIWNGKFVPANTPIEFKEAKGKKTDGKTDGKTEEQKDEQKEAQKDEN